MKKKKKFYNNKMKNRNKQGFFFIKMILKLYFNI